MSLHVDRICKYYYFRNDTIRCVQDVCQEYDITVMICDYLQLLLVGSLRTGTGFGILLGKMSTSQPKVRCINMWHVME